MKKFLMSFILIVILVVFVINYFSPVLLADSASCSSEGCSCSCSGTLRWCIAHAGTCTCRCSTGSKANCGGGMEEVVVKKSKVNNEY